MEDQRTRVVSETHYAPANLMARVLNALMIRRMFGKAQASILQNISNLTKA